MSFQRGQVGRRESIGGGSKSNILLETASESIDPMPPHKASVGMTCSLKPVLTDDIPAEACSSNRKNTLNGYPSPKALIAGTDPLSLTRNDYKKESFCVVSPNSVRDGGCFSAMRARGAV